MIDFKKALVHFEASDPTMTRLALAALSHERALTVPKARRPEQYFEELVSSIVGQQLSTKAADTIWGRVEALVGPVTPANLAKVPHDDLRSVGMSHAKANYVHGLAEDVLSGRLKLNNLDKLADEAVIDRLIAVKGIGRWSAEMFLMFTLGRPDVFSAGDLGLIRSIETHYERPGVKPEDVLVLSQRWSPHRTTAALVLWHSRDN